MNSIHSIILFDDFSDLITDSNIRDGSLNI